MTVLLVINFFEHFIVGSKGFSSMNSGFKKDITKISHK